MTSAAEIRTAPPRTGLTNCQAHQSAFVFQVSRQQGPFTSPSSIKPADLETLLVKNV